VGTGRSLRLFLRESHCEAQNKKKGRGNMSQIVRTKAGIVHPDLGLLREAVELVASQHEEGRVQDHYLDWDRNAVPTTTGLALYTQQLHRGIGLDVDPVSGELVFQGDPHNVGVTFAAVQAEIKQAYTALVGARVLRELGWETSFEEGDNQTLVVVAREVHYA
jgi:hypothetical protein